MASELAVLGNEPADREPGLRLCRVDGTTGELGPVVETAAPGSRTMYATRRGNYLYAVDADDEGTVGAFRLDTETGTLTGLNRRSTDGATPCYCSVNADGEYLFVANFGGGSVAMLPIGADGSLGTPADVVSATPPDHPDPVPEPHAAVPGPEDRYLYVPDRGNDVVGVFRIDRESDRLRRAGADPVAVHDDSGPRHLRFSATGEAYLITEHDGSMAVFEQVSDTGDLRETATLSTLPAGYDGENHAADARIHPSGGVVYGTNRGHDSIAVFDRGENGTLDSPTHVEAGGAWPWGLGLSADGERLYAANYEGDCVTPFSVGADGSLEKDGDSLELPSPYFVSLLD